MAMVLEPPLLVVAAGVPVEAGTADEAPPLAD